MIRSLRGRLFVGLTAIILLTGATGSMFAYRWAFGEAIEIQDSILIQLASLAQSGAISGGQPLHGVEEDTGPGIAPQHLPRVFEPFYRADASRSRETGGAGLGLAIALSIVQAHDGELALTNRTEGGLRATMKLPQ
jgi:nitrogen fixation/metabolism regulation signal transduction histidine kinase